MQMYMFCRFDDTLKGIIQNHLTDYFNLFYFPHCSEVRLQGIEMKPLTLVLIMFMWTYDMAAFVVCCVVALHKGFHAVISCY